MRDLVKHLDRAWPSGISVPAAMMVKLNITLTMQSNTQLLPIATYAHQELNEENFVNTAKHS